MSRKNPAGPDNDLKSSVEHVYQWTRRAILDGNYAPDSPLRLQELATTCGVSMIPVREALRLLEAEGFVETIPNRGARVAPLSLDDMQDVYGMRIMLESQALKQAFPRISPAQIARARRLNAKLVRQFARQGYASDDDHREFHFLLFEPSSSRWLMRMIGTIWDHSERYRRLGAPLITGESAAEEHERIVAAVEAGDLERARQALVDHLEASRDVVAEALTMAQAERPAATQT